MNGVAPVRRGREAEARRNDISNLVKEQASIQEEVVSSSESTVQGRRQLTYSDGDADSLTNDTEDPNICEAASAVSSQSSEAERKEL
ncbi:hypothetical protein CEXT_510621 [Caerostris extrusa]|uniref:Uncharacterized protein n=1 Tax=Caerostris extrusa TaxID=172846 RepID=A0AAV4Q7I4_CAEEX|nr:hypothetical protein CEXT_510621 [Caerostris extrusa]